MRYGETIRLEPISKERWSTLRENTKIYELNLPPYKKVQKLKGKVKHWESNSPGESPRYYYTTHSKVDILEVTRIWTNPKNTVKVILAGEGFFSLFSKIGRPEGFTSLRWERYSDTVPDVFDNLKIGSFLVIKGDNDNRGKRNLFFISNESTIKDVIKILDYLQEIYHIRSKENEFKWKEDQYSVSTYGTVSKIEVERQRLIFFKTLRNLKWLRRKDQWDLFNAVKANLSIKNDGKELKVKLKALDGNTYFLETKVIPKEEEKMIGWRESSLFKLDFWLPFVYRKRNDVFLSYSNKVKTEHLLEEFFLNIPRKLPESRIILGFNHRRVTITRKKTAKNSVLNYLDGKVIKAADMETKLKEYFLLGKSITPSLKKGLSSNQRKQSVLSKEAQNLIEKGLNGKMRDLEGELPFHLNVIYKEEERKWYLEMAGKKFYIKGGYNALKKIKTAISGSGLVQKRELGYDCRDTKVIRYRLGELVGDKNALWIILHVKKMGALYKAIGSSS